jgi:hypothetical protein
VAKDGMRSQVLGLPSTEQSRVLAVVSIVFAMVRHETHKEGGSGRSPAEFEFGGRSG